MKKKKKMEEGFVEIKGTFSGMENQDNKKISNYEPFFSEQKLPFARCLGSKSFYRKTNPDHLIIFNSRIYLKEDYEKYKQNIQKLMGGREYEIWYGDLDLNLDIYKLYKIHYDIKSPLVVTSEMGNKIIEIGDLEHIIGFCGDKKLTLNDLKKKSNKK